MFGIVQGGIDAALRTESAARTVDVGFDGYAIGGLSVGETRDEMLPALDAATAVLPPDRVRGQLHPLVVPQDSQTKHDPAGRIRTPQVEQ